MKFNFKQSLLLLSTTFGMLAVTNSSSIIAINNIKQENSFKSTAIKGTQTINKTVDAPAQGDIDYNKKMNNVWFSHSELSPTGIFVTKDSTVEITIPEAANDMFAFVGQWGEYKNLNGGEDLELQKISLDRQITTFQPEQDGMLYISNQYSSYDFQVIINAIDAIEVPTFIVDETTSDQFNQSLNDSDSPFVELIGKNVFGTFQMELANKLWKNNLTNIDKLNDTIKNWDEIYQLSNHVSGLSLDFDGVAQKHHNLVHIANPDKGAGYASATNKQITFQQDTDAGEDLFTDDKSQQWTLWHEMGHTYQNLDYTFDDFVEVTVNINSFSIQEAQGFRNRIFNDQEKMDIIEEFVNSSDPNKNIEDLNVWGRLGLFLQLHMAYGKEFYPTLNQEYRVAHDSLKLDTNEEQYQTFIKLTSKVVNRNLIPFFEKWGIKANQETTTEVSEYQELTTDIWNNILDGNIEENAIIDYELPEYNPVSGVEIKDGTPLKVNAGDRLSEKEIQDQIENIASDITIEKTSGPNWKSVNWEDDVLKNYSTIEVSQSDKINNKYWIPTTISTNNSIKALGLGDNYKGIFGLNTTDKKFFMSSNNSKLHPYYKDEPYIFVSIFDDHFEEIYNISVNGDETTNKFIGLNNLNYENGYKIKFWFAEANRGLYYDNDQWNPVADGGAGEITFEIIDGSWVKK